MHECPDRKSSDKFGCEEVKSICAYYHSTEERDELQKCWSEGVPSKIPYIKENIDWYDD